MIFLRDIAIALKKMHFFQQICTKMLTSLLKNTTTELYCIKINKNKRLHIVDNYL